MQEQENKWHLVIAQRAHVGTRLQSRRVDEEAFAVFANDALNAIEKIKRIPGIQDTRPIDSRPIPKNATSMLASIAQSKGYKLEKIGGTKGHLRLNFEELNRLREFIRQKQQGSL